MMNVVSVEDAALHLGIQPRRVRALIKSGQLDAEKVGNAWVIPMDSVRARIASAPKAGSPLSVKNAWSLLALLENGEVPTLSRQERWRVRRLLAEAPEFGRWPRWLAHRGELAHVRLNPRLRDKFLQDDRVVRSSLRGVPDIDIDLDSLAPVHVAAGDFDSLQRQYRGHVMSSFERGESDVRAIIIPSVESDREERAPYRASAAVDLLGNHDPRVRAAAARYLSSLPGYVLEAP